jgi:hypothetical protein
MLRETLYVSVVSVTVALSVSVAGVDEIYIVYWFDTDHKQRSLRVDQNDNELDLKNC